MEKWIEANEAVYDAVYKVMYPKEYGRSTWEMIKVEVDRVSYLNRRKPPGACDIKTYGSRIGEAVMAAVNIAIKTKEEKG